MKKLFYFLTLSVVILFVSSFKTNNKVDSIEFYDNSQKKELDELISNIHSQSRTPIIYFYANWCKPCVAFKKNLKHKSLIETLANTTLIKINIDEDGNEDNLVGQYGVTAVPTFIKVDKDGGIIAKITSGKWGKDNVKNTVQF